MAGINFINEEEYSKPLTFKNNDVIHVVAESFYCLKKQGVIEEHEKCDKQCSYCKMEKSLQ